MTALEPHTRVAGAPASEAPVSVAVAVAAPALVWLVGAAVVLAATLGGYRALAAPTDLTMSEAAALRDGAEVLRQIQHGVDPNVAVRVRPGVVGDSEQVMTALEAAIAGRHVEIVELLAAHGASLDAARASALLCLARDREATDIIAFLEARAAGSDTRCDEVRRPW